MSTRVLVEHGLSWLTPLKMSQVHMSRLLQSMDGADFSATGRSERKLSQGQYEIIESGSTVVIIIVYVDS